MSERIDAQLVQHISHLARLDLSEEEVSRFGGQLSDVLAYMDKLNEVDTEGVEPTAHSLPLTDVFRGDEPTPSLGVERTLQNAPDKAAPYFKVPKVLEQESS